jgi:hypothetical protein
VRPYAEQLAAKIASTPQLRAAMDRLLEHLPTNWPRGVKLQQVIEVIQDDGLPLIWVAPAEVVTVVLAAPSRDARIAVLLDHTDELVQDCCRILAEVSAERLVTQLPLHRKYSTP